MFSGLFASCLLRIQIQKQSYSFLDKIVSHWTLYEHFEKVQWLKGILLKKLSSFVQIMTKANLIGVPRRSWLNKCSISEVWMWSVKIMKNCCKHIYTYWTTHIRWSLTYLYTKPLWRRTIQVNQRNGSWWSITKHSCLGSNLRFWKIFNLLRLWCG